GGLDRARVAPDALRLLDDHRMSGGVGVRGRGEGHPTVEETSGEAKHPRAVAPEPQPRPGGRERPGEELDILGLAAPGPAAGPHRAPPPRPRRPRAAPRATAAAVRIAGSPAEATTPG